MTPFKFSEPKLIPRQINVISYILRGKLCSHNISRAKLTGDIQDQICLCEWNSSCFTSDFMCRETNKKKLLFFYLNKHNYAPQKLCQYFIKFTEQFFISIYYSFQVLVCLFVLLSEILHTILFQLAFYSYVITLLSLFALQSSLTCFKFQTSSLCFIFKVIVASSVCYSLSLFCF